MDVVGVALGWHPRGRLRRRGPGFAESVHTATLAHERVAARVLVWAPVRTTHNRCTRTRITCTQYVHEHTKTYDIATIGQFINWMHADTDPVIVVKAKELLAFMQLVQLDAWPMCSGPNGKMRSSRVLRAGRCDDSVS